jgi:hypothetical protein
MSSLSVFIIAQQKYYSLSGRITDANDSTAIPSANIFIEGTQLGATSNLTGNYFIDNIPEGKHIIRLSYVGLRPQRHTLVFTGDKLSFYKSYIMGFIVIKPKQRKEIKDYYKKLESSAGNRKIIEIKLDSLLVNKGSITIYSTFHNNTNYPVYIASHNCKASIVLPIEKLGGKAIIPISFTNFWDSNSDQDEKIIPPQGNYQYPPMIERLPNDVYYSYDTYKISLKYHAEPKEIQIEYNDNLSANYYKTRRADYESRLQWGLPGVYLSENFLTFNNFNCTYDKGHVSVVIFNCNKQQQLDKGILYESSIRINDFSNKNHFDFDTSFVSVDNENGAGIVQAEWTSDSKFFVFNTSLSGGHHPWHTPTYAYSIDEKRLISLDKTTGPVCSSFKLLPPDYIKLSTSTKDIKVQKEITIRLSDLLNH